MISNNTIEFDEVENEFHSSTKVLSESSLDKTSDIEVITLTDESMEAESDIDDDKEGSGLYVGGKVSFCFTKLN